jgi:hypothetical protein
MTPPHQAGNALQSAAAEAAHRSAARLAGLQAPDGHWQAPVTLAAPLDAGAPDLETAVKAYAALKFAGTSEEALIRLRSRILDLGGLEAVRNAALDLPLDELKTTSGGGLRKLLARFGGKPKAPALDGAAYRKAVLAPLTSSGGTAFEPVRDTALAARALAEIDPGHAAIGRAADWLLKQSAGLPVEIAASVHVALALAGRATPEPTPDRWESADTTGSVLEALGPNHAATRRGIDWLVERQAFDGSWPGRWGVAWLYGTCFALRGLAAAGESDREAHVLRAGEWVRSIQNSDGGWGEECAGLDSGSFQAGPSTPSQTAWAILGLIAGGDPDSLSVRHGVDYLVRTQLADGSWAEDRPTGVALPGAVYVRRELDKDLFPLMALAAFMKARPNV